MTVIASTRHTLSLLRKLQAASKGLDGLLQHGLPCAPPLRHCQDVPLNLPPGTYRTITTLPGDWVRGPWLIRMSHA